MHQIRIPSVFLVLGGIALGVILDSGAQRWLVPAASAQGTPAPTLNIPVDVAHLKDIVPSQSHSMLDVGEHWKNLWFAAQKKNWPLAQFYYDEARQHILWTIRIRPIRRAPDGSDVDIKAIFEAIDTTSMAAVKQAIEKKSSVAFVGAYKTMLTSCYACHKSSGKPYLRPMVPVTTAQSIINLDPNAIWPE